MGSICNEGLTSKREESNQPAFSGTGRSRSQLFSIAVILYVVLLRTSELITDFNYGSSPAAILLIFVKRNIFL
jgi:hypothetical protein